MVTKIWAAFGGDRRLVLAPMSGKERRGAVLGGRGGCCGMVWCCPKRGGGLYRLQGRERGVETMAGDVTVHVVCRALRRGLGVRE
jgi:hypothetical protein